MRSNEAQGERLDTVPSHNGDSEEISATLIHAETECKMSIRRNERSCNHISTCTKIVSASSSDVICIRLFVSMRVRECVRAYVSALYIIC